MAWVSALAVVLAVVCVVSLVQIVRVKRKSAVLKAAPQESVQESPVASSSTLHDTDEVLGLRDHGEAEVPATVRSAAVIPVPEHIAVHLIADHERPYVGYELLQALLSCGLRYGDMNIFHRHEQKTGVGPVLFSLARMTEPGTFDLAKIGGLSCNGLTLFFSVKSVEDPAAVFDLLLRTAGQLVEDLGGKVYDHHRKLMTQSSVRPLIAALEHARDSARSQTA